MIFLLMLLGVSGITIKFVEEDGSPDIYFDPMAIEATDDDTLIFELINPLGDCDYWNYGELRYVPLIESLPRHRHYYNDRYEAIGQDINGVFYVQAELPKLPWYKSRTAKLTFFGLGCAFVGFIVGGLR